MIFYMSGCMACAVIMLIFYSEVSVTLKPLYMTEFVCMDIALMLSIYWLAPDRLRGFVVAVVWVLGLLLGANALYYRYWGVLLSVTTIFNPASYNTFVVDAVAKLITARDLAYIGVPVVMTVVWVMMRRHKERVALTWRLSLFGLSLIVFVAGGAMRVRRYAIYLHNIGITDNSVNTALRIMYGQFGGPSGLSELSNQGIAVFSMSQCIMGCSDRYMTLDCLQRKRIDEYVASREDAERHPLGGNENKNLILIIVESLNANYIGRIAGGENITPVLSSLIDMEGTVSALNVVSQVAEGGSSDGQMIYNTGLLPIHAGAAAVIYGDNSFPSLAHTFSDRMTIEVIPEHKKVWNHGVTSISYGYKRLLDNEDMVNAGHSVEKRGADGALFDFALQVADTISQPFMMTIPTISMHYPFTNVGVPEMGHMTSNEFLNDNERAYMNSLSYFDTELGKFLSALNSMGIADNTVTVIVSDHNTGVADPNEWMSNNHDNPIAFIALNTGCTVRIEDVAGQVDAFPTILDIMGVDSPTWRGLGVSMLDPKRPQGAKDSAGKLYGKPSTLLDEQWVVSDWIIRSNYFDK